MMIIFHFIFLMLKIPILKVELSRFLKKSICTKCLILQNVLHVDEILFFEKFQLNGALKILMYYQIMNVIMKLYQFFKYEIDLNTILTQLVSNIFSTYFYHTKVFEMYPTSHKLNVGPYGFIFLLQNILNLLSCVHIKNCSIF
jgi:hypothetical protein